MKKRTKRPGKQTSARVSTIAATYLRAIARGGRLYWDGTGKSDATRFVAILAASCLSQDETPGQKPKAKKRARRR
jgi:hypothetical protein